MVCVSSMRIFLAEGVVAFYDYTRNTGVRWERDAEGEWQANVCA